MPRRCRKPFVSTTATNGISGEQGIPICLPFKIVLLTAMDSQSKRFLRRMTKPVVLSRGIDIGVRVSIAIFAMAFCFAAGRRGFFSLDQSIFFDGAYRIVAGQVPFKDFVSPYGPMCYWIPAVFFKGLGVNFPAFLAAACVMNALAALMAADILRVLFPLLRIVSWGGSLLTGLWFYPIFGTPSSEQTMFFFILAGTWLLLRAFAGASNVRVRWVALFAAGTCYTAAVLCKQTAIVFFMLPPLVILAGSLESPSVRLLGVLTWLFGVLASAGFFAIWILWFSDPEMFYEVWFESIRGVGIRRLQHFLSLRWAVYGKISLGIKISFCVMVTAVLAGLGCLMSGYRSKVQSRENFSIAVWLLLTLLICQWLMVSLTGNEYALSFSFLGLSCALAAAILWPSTPGTFLPNTGFWLAPALAFLLFLLPAHEGFFLALGRTVHNTNRRVMDYQEISTVPELRFLQWPVYRKQLKVKGTPYVVTGNHIEKLYAYLKKKDRNFLILGEHTFFYGILGKVPPQPLLWFQAGRTYPRRKNNPWDPVILQSLKVRGVSVVVLEAMTFLQARGNPPTLQDFKKLKSYLENHYRQVRQIGIFRVYEKIEEDGRNPIKGAP